MVILNYNTYSETIGLVDALQNQSLARDLFIVVVDNFSPNESFEKLKPLESRFPNVKVLQTGANLGYARGNNFGLKYLAENIHPEYVAILNNDVILPDDSFERLISRYKELDRPAVISPVMLTPEGKRVIPRHLNTFLDDCLSCFYILRGLLNVRKPKEMDNTGKKAMKVDWIPGSFMFVSFGVFRQMGFFYPNTFLYAEERFITHKARQLGLNNYIILDDTYVHAHKSPTISQFYSRTGKYKLLYDGWCEYTRLFRSCGKVKYRILYQLTRFSLWEIRLMERINKLSVGYRDNAKGE